ncbi:hypothetical protein PMW_74 [Pseudomonas phage phiPMW]|uniref:Uncharacterized protein n=1 Tax=Pseudomonas phage phiPMW TaxID=1815582 RepID=A0A1S5R1D1_9CAUD|nr:hypothetical protein FDG97_gp074 [Pseudomonas phage phiPMW]ANA49199.1 hypothetical protein PMW_74 [Pseudomonas phage phiPMW]
MRKQIQYPPEVYKPYYCEVKEIGGVLHYAFAEERKFLWFKLDPKLHRSDYECGIVKGFAGQVWHQDQADVVNAVWAQRRKDEREWLDNQRAAK